VKSDDLRRLAEALPKAKAIRYVIARQDPSMVRRIALEERAALALADLDPPDAARLLADMRDWVANVEERAIQDREPDYEEMERLLARFDRLGEDPAIKHKFAIVLRRESPA